MNVLESREYTPIKGIKNRKRQKHHQDQSEVFIFQDLYHDRKNQ